MSSTPIGVQKTTAFKNAHFNTKQKQKRVTRIIWVFGHN